MPVAPAAGKARARQGRCLVPAMEFLGVAEQASGSDKLASTAAVYGKIACTPALKLSQLPKSLTSAAASNARTTRQHRQRQGTQLPASPQVVLVGHALVDGIGGLAAPQLRSLVSSGGGAQSGGHHGGQLLARDPARDAVACTRRRDAGAVARDMR